MLQSFLDDTTSRKISHGRLHKDYLDKSEIGVARNSKRNFHKIFSNAKSPSIENELHTYRVSKWKDRNKHMFFKTVLTKITTKKL